MSLPILNYEKYGSKGAKVIILHGLFGSGKNWASIAKDLAESYEVYTVDARNHGKSFHHPEHSVKAMSEDLERFFEHLKISQAFLIGHSMGGLTAMRFSLLNQEKILGLIVVDIAPRAYNIGYENEFKALSLDLSPFKSRQEIDKVLVTIIPNTAIRQFLQTNIERDEKGNFRWILNVEVLKNSPKRADPELPDDLVVTKNTVFYRALKEKFILDEDLPLIHKFFPKAKVIPFNEGNHWLHITAREKFLDETKKILLTIQKN